MFGKLLDTSELANSFNILKYHPGLTTEAILIKFVNDTINVVQLIVTPAIIQRAI